MVATARTRDNNGFLMVQGCPISSFGILDYAAGQLGLPGDPNRIVKVFRPEEAVKDPSAMDSFKNVPFIVDHEMLSGFEDDSETESPDDYGVDGVLTSNVYYDAPWMRGDIKIFSRRAQKALAARKKDLSLGYSCDFELRPGVWNGQPYEAIQTNMRGNHIALVDEGRVPGARVLDGQSIIYDHLNFDVRPSDKGNDMSKRNTKVADNAVAKLKALLPALEQFLNEEATEPAHQGGEGAAGGAGAAEGAAGGGAAAGAAGAEGAAAGTEGDAGGAAGAEGAAAGTAGAEGAGGAAAEGGGEGAQLPQLITEIEGILAELKAACGGEGSAGAAGGAATGDEGANGEGSAEGTDTVEGLQNGEGGGVTDEGAGTSPGESAGRASPGPAQGKHTQAADASIQRFYADLAAKDSLYQRLSAVVGAFPHKAMDARQVAAYGVKKIGLTVAKGQEMIALDAYLGGIEKAAKDAKVRVQQTVGGVTDSAVKVPDEFAAYLGTKKE